MDIIIIVILVFIALQGQGRKSAKKLYFEKSNQPLIWYITINTMVHFALFATWMFVHSEFKEPTQLTKKEGWSVVEVLTFGVSR